MCYAETVLREKLKSDPTNSRLVVLLRSSERRRVEQLAAAENVSAAEIVRRSLDSYETAEARLRREHEEELLTAAVSMLDTALSGVNASIAHTCDKLDALHLELKRRSLA